MQDLSTHARRRFARVWFAAKTAVLLSVLAALPQPTGAQEPPPEAAPALTDQTEIWLDLRGKVRPRVKLAIPEFEQAGSFSSEGRPAAEVLEKTLRRDLQESGVFTIQGPEALSVLNLTGDIAIDGELIRSLDNEMVLQATVREEPGKIVIEGRVIDLASGQQILGKLYRGEFRVARRIAHSLSDEIVRQFSGRPGLALTSLAFYSDRTGNKEIYLMDYDGASQRPITNHQTISLAPTWAPDGNRIAYITFVRGYPAIFEVNVSSGAKKDLIADGTKNLAPSYSADGRQLAFSRSLAGNSEIFASAADGSSPRRLTHNNGIDTNPEWSPTGREIAFTSSRSGSPQIYVMDKDGANLLRISRSGNYNEGATWSPDGTRIAYSSRRRNGTFEILMNNVVTGESVVLTPWAGSHEAPTFSPDGRQIAYASTRTRGGRRTTQIHVMSIDGSGDRQLTSEGNNLSPNWSSFQE